MDNDYVTPSQAATLCRVSARTIRNWLTKGYIKRYIGDNGYNVYIQRKDLMRYDALRRSAKRGNHPQWTRKR